MMWSWIPSNWSQIWELTRQNAFLGIVSPLIGLAISLPLGVAGGAVALVLPADAGRSST